ncbi:DedA family protein [Rhodopirellula halodulae]|uniref:DedA family protein n=1 Tax=Rhodopirellula halodulae TaxID=2894198 RepID=UPI001E574C24|nr:DedA family protein [Rhodopirellula sp. JC737]MCC9658380.1 DedA family protein [Rhodopirellula sp. JC737]
MDQWIEQVLEQFGAVGVAALMLLENVFPPIPSEVVMPWAGYAATQGFFSFPAAVLAGSIGSFAGAFGWYWLARKVGKTRLASWVDRHGAWLTLSLGDLDAVERWFDRWGTVAVFVCRLIPGLRTFISVPAGFSKMPMGPFCIYTLLGTVLWTAMLTGIGAWLGRNHEDLAGPLGWISTSVIIAMFVWWCIRLVRQTRRRTQQNVH